MWNNNTDPAIVFRWLCELSVFLSDWRRKHWTKSPRNLWIIDHLLQRFDRTSKLPIWIAFRNLWRKIHSMYMSLFVIQLFRFVYCKLSRVSFEEQRNSVANFPNAIDSGVLPLVRPKRWNFISSIPVSSYTVLLQICEVRTVRRQWVQRSPNM